jgi:hypothetical protein
LAQFIDESVRQYGQPYLVSVTKLPQPNGDPRPIAINWFWRTDEATALKVDQVKEAYRMTYATKNRCHAVRLDAKSPGEP